MVTNTFVRISRASRDNPSYKSFANLQKYKKAIASKNVALVKLYDINPRGKQQCMTCKEEKFYNHFRSIKITKRGLKRTCYQCERKRMDFTNYKEKSMVRRATKNGYIITSSPKKMIESLIAKQENRCYYTNIQFENTAGHPFSFSPERVDRGGGYTRQNTRLVLQILNVGGTMNWTHTLTNQIARACSFATHHVKSDFVQCKTTIRKLKQILYDCKKNSKKRATSSHKRNDFSGVFDVNYTTCIDMLEKQEYRCALSKLPLVFESKHEWMASLDRVNPRYGYTMGNVRFVISRLNGPITWSTDLWSRFLFCIEKEKKKKNHNIK